jgi:hypothetical protein
VRCKDTRGHLSPLVQCWNGCINLVAALTGFEPGMRDFVPPLGRGAVVVVAVLCALSVGFASYWAVLGTYDWMFISGCAFAVLGILLAHGLPNRLEEALNRLGDRGALVVGPERGEHFEAHLETRIRLYWAPCAGSVVAAAIAIAFVVAFSAVELQYKLPFLAGAVLGGYVVGCYLGRLACYGLLGYFLSRAHVGISVIAGHPDTVGGLKPIGDFYLRQAAIVGLPAVFIATWLVLIRLPLFTRYQVWRDSYVGLLFLAILFETTSFVAPLWWFHHEMVRQKRILLREADRLWPEIARLQSAMAQCDDPSDIKALKDRLDERISRYSTIEQLPVWPVDLRAKRLFSLSNVALFIPFLAEATGVAGPWTELVQKLFERAAGGH